jgi:hypothetical protein
LGLVKKNWMKGFVFFLLNLKDKDVHLISAQILRVILVSVGVMPKASEIRSSMH